MVTLNSKVWSLAAFLIMAVLLSSCDSDVVKLDSETSYIGRWELTSETGEGGASVYNRLSWDSEGGSFNIVEGGWLEIAHRVYVGCFSTETYLCEGSWVAEEDQVLVFTYQLNEGPFSELFSKRLTVFHVDEYELHAKIESVMVGGK